MFFFFSLNYQRFARYTMFFYYSIVLELYINFMSFIFIFCMNYTTKNFLLYLFKSTFTYFFLFLHLMKVFLDQFKCFVEKYKEKGNYVYNYFLTITTLLSSFWKQK